MSEGNNDLLKGLIIGGLIGAALGILYAPKSGKETREDIARRTDDFINKAKEEYEKTIAKSKEAYESAICRWKELEASAKGKMEEAEGKVNELAQQTMETVQENKNRLKKAIDAGVDAYREEKNKTTI